VAAPVPGLGQLQIHRPDAGEHLALRLVAVAHYMPAALVVGVVVVGQKRLEVGLHGLSDRALGVSADQVGYLIATGGDQERNCRIVGYGGTLFILHQWLSHL
jgi:hypothetical protein